VRENGSGKADAEPSQHGNVTRGVGVQDVDLGCCGNGDAFCSGADPRAGFQE
jgi:hypothetical protein